MYSNGLLASQQFGIRIFVADHIYCEDSLLAHGGKEEPSAWERSTDPTSLRVAARAIYDVPEPERY
jgi:hypothetical protein